jgi:hypothetical protein
MAVIGVANSTHSFQLGTPVDLTDPAKPQPPNLRSVARTERICTSSFCVRWRTGSVVPEGKGAEEGVF